MGIYDRDYYRSPVRGGFGDFQPWSVTTWLIVINIVVFVLDGLIGRLLAGSTPFPSTGPLQDWGAFSIDTAISHLQVWRFLTFQFLHASVGHIFFNMLGLYFFGPIVESQLGARRYLGFYLSCGFAGALMFVALWGVGFLVESPNVPLIGASAGIFGVLLAAARLAPNMTITLWFPPIPMPLRVLAWGYLGIAVYSVLVSGGNAGGEAAHIGGGLWGFLLIRNEHWLNFLVPRSRGNRRIQKRKVEFRDWTRDPNH